MADAAPKLGGMLQEMSRFYLHFYETVGKFDGCSLHDPAAVIACTHPELFTTESVAITVSTEGEAMGETTRADDNRRATDVMMGVDDAAVKSLFIDRIQALS